MTIPGVSKLRARELLADHDYHVPGMSDEEIGKRLGISYGRVYQLRLRAIAKIQAAILDDPELRELASDVCGYEVGTLPKPRRPAIKHRKRKGHARGMLKKEN